MVWDRRNDVIELFDNAVVHRESENLKADYIKLDLKSRMLHAKGRCQYQAGGALIQSEELAFNLDTGAGTIINGQISNGRFMLVGERINRLGPTRFQAHKAEYTTCQDCPSSWTLTGEDVEMEVEGYAHLHNVKTRIKDTPILWLPYAVIPIKTKRQTGLLFPRFGRGGSDGTIFVLPFFWAISRSTDMTIGLGSYSERGTRLEWEGRYALAEGSSAEAKYFLTRDHVKIPEEALQGTSTARSAPLRARKVQGLIPKAPRWAVDIQQRHELKDLGMYQKLRFLEISDNKYPIDFSGDVPGRGESTLTSSLILNQASSFETGFIEARRTRDLLNFDQPVHFDPDTVQLYPRAVLTTNDRYLFGLPVAAGFSLGVSNFVRPIGPFDYDSTSTLGDPFRPGVDPVREATRFSATPSLYTTLRVADRVSIVPSLQYRNYFYDFHNTIPDLQRGYLLFQIDLFAQWERIYHSDDIEFPRTKHLIRPLLKYSRIPYIRESQSAFVEQIGYKSGYNFDNNDIVPVSNSPSLVNYFTPLGHSVSYGVVNQLIRRRQSEGAGAPKYERTVEVTAGQTFNILEMKKSPKDRIPFSRAFVTKELEYDSWYWQTQYYFYPYIGKLLPTKTASDRSPHEVITTGKYVFERATKYYVLEYERSIGLNYAFNRLESYTNGLGTEFKFSINDFFQPVLAASYAFQTHEFIDWLATFNFQSPSRCWKLVATLGRAKDRRGVQVGVTAQFNLTGDRFGTFDDF